MTRLGSTPASRSLCTRIHPIHRYIGGSVNFPPHICTYFVQFFAEVGNRGSEVTIGLSQQDETRVAGLIDLMYRLAVSSQRTPVISTWVPRVKDLPR